MSTREIEEALKDYSRITGKAERALRALENLRVHAANLRIERAPRGEANAEAWRFFDAIAKEAS
jgi:hypothetical protein